MKKVLSILLSLCMLFSITAGLDFSAFAQDCIISVADVEAKSGSSVTVDVSIKNNPGILGALVTLEYSNYLTLKSASSGSAFSALTMTSPGKLVSPCRFSWDGIELNDNDVKDGTILSLSFDVSENAPIGEKCNVNISYQIGDIVDNDLNSVNPVVNNGSITIISDACLHNNIQTLSSVAPSCTATGKTEGKKCLDCGEIIVAQTTVSALGHDWNDGVVTKAPTETATGVKKYTCKRSGCGATKNETIPMLSHSHSYTSVVTAPTCTAKGYTTHTCSCGDSYVDSYVNANGHTPVTIPAVAPTCTTVGKTEGTKCSVCNTVIKSQSSVAKLGHNYSNGVCILCGAKDDSVTVETEITVINLNEPLTYPSYSDTENHRIAFTPDKTGHYYFNINSSTCDDPANAEIRNSNGKLLGRDDYIWAGTCIFFYANAGDTCYITINYLESEQHIGESFVLEIGYIAENHSSYDKNIKKATLTENGTKTVECAWCGANKKKETIYSPKTITLSETKYTYDGKAKKPTVKVVDSKGKTISKSNYKLTYKNNKNIGKASVKITFKGDYYSGSKTLYFTINPKAASISSVKSKKSKQITVKWKKDTKVTGYEIQYSTDKKFKKSVKKTTIKKNKTTSTTIKKLKGNKKYYVRVRTYKKVNGTKYYSSWSKAKTVKTKK